MDFLTYYFIIGVIYLGIAAGLSSSTGATAKKYPVSFGLACLVVIGLWPLFLFNDAIERFRG